jgi:hypothetical protein
MVFGTDVKMSAHALEQDRPDVLKRRRAWFNGRLGLDPEKLIFIEGPQDGLATKMARLRGRALRGERCGAWSCPLTTGQDQVSV